MTARAERRAIAALLAVFALLLQALTPGLALANTNAAGGEVICTASGTTHGAAGAGQPSGGHSHESGCDHCVCPGASATPASADDLDPTVVQYAQAAAPAGFTAAPCAPGRGLAAPPPPSRGPPQLTI